MLLMSSAMLTGCTDNDNNSSSQTPETTTTTTSDFRWLTKEETKSILANALYVSLFNKEIGKDDGGNDHVSDQYCEYAIKIGLLIEIKVVEYYNGSSSQYINGSIKYTNEDTSKIVTSLENFTPKN